MINGKHAKKKNKFGAVRKEVDGINFDSTGESTRYGQLIIMYKAGLISKPILQYEFMLPGGVKYICDFLYLDYELKDFVVEDFKGHRTQGYIDKKKQMLALYGINIFETGTATVAHSRKKSKKD